MIHLLYQPATGEQIKEMLEVHAPFIKVAVDTRQQRLAGGGEFHADCGAVLVEAGSDRKDIWGADWVPQTKVVRFGALINIRPRTNKGMEIQDPDIRKHVEQIVRKLLDV